MRTENDMTKEEILHRLVNRSQRLARLAVLRAPASIIFKEVLLVMNMAHKLDETEFLNTLNEAGWR
jgi:hypothetical protein